MQGKHKVKQTIGNRVQNFELPDQNGNKIVFDELLGQGSIVLFFYPKDDSPGCTKEACAFRDAYEVFREAGAEVIGISSDSEDSHRRFKEKHNLPYTLLSDKNSKVGKLFGVPNTLGVLPGRVTFVIDKNGVLRYTFSSQLSMKKHIEEALRVIHNLSDTANTGSILIEQSHN